jgi:hypothetical protein
MKLIITAMLGARKPENLVLILGGDRYLRMHAILVSSFAELT